MKKATVVRGKEGSGSFLPGEPTVNQWDFLLGHRYCTYNAAGQAVVHTDDREGAIRDDSDWAWDNQTKRWIKIPA